jgi:hypothetical protein
MILIRDRERPRSRIVAFATDPLLRTCGGRMRIVSFITGPRVIDRIVPHLQSARSKAQNPFEPRSGNGAGRD